MGVRGLTSYIARNADRYLDPFELHDCDLVIDGDNLACNLFKDVSDTNPAFGGDYDTFYRSIINFFQLLNECHVRAFVLMDGGYELKKMKTIEQRLRSKIGMIKHINPTQSKPLFPLMMREVFVDAVKDSGVHVMRCMFEADDEIAVLARKLNCPVLSYDSDFYIHNVKYIPIVTLTMKVHTKSSAERKIERKLRHCEAKNIAKRTQIKIEVEGGEAKPLKKAKHKTVKYLDCCIYTIKNLAGPYLKTEMLPIFAALLGNDYIDRRQFRKFYTQLGFRGRNNTVAKQQKRIRAILKWLRHETKESAIEKILMRMPKNNRGRLMAQLESATSGYSCEDSEAFDFFSLNEVIVAGDEAETDDEEVYLSEEELEDISTEENAEESEEKSTDDTEEESTDSEGLEDNENDGNVSDCEEEEEHEDENEYTSEKNPEILEPPTIVPEWLKQRVYNAELPRYITDLIHLRMYINNPQIENFLFVDCNEIALKILLYIFTIVNRPNEPELRYLTRVVRLTNVHYKTLQPLDLEFDFDPDAIDIVNFKAIFADLRNSENIFETIKKIPAELELYFLAISYWARQTKHSSQVHLHSLLICFIVLSVIDTKVEPIRDIKRFQKKFGKIASKTRNLRAKLIKNKETNELASSESLNQNLQANKKERSLLERIKFIPKSECILVMENLLKYFHLNECFLRRHNDFSSTILHGFSEFQSVFYHLSCLNALFNHPFQPTRISQCYNGMFLYNIYENLKTRLDIQYYVLNFIFHESPTLTEYYLHLVEWSADVMTLLAKNDTIKPANVKKLAKNKKKIPLGDIVETMTSDMVVSGSNSEDSEYNDLNNKFSMLLKTR